MYSAFYGPAHWGWVIHIYIGKLNIIVSDNGLSPGWRQVIIWINYIFIQENAFEKVFCKMAAILSQPQCVKSNYFWSDDDYRVNQVIIGLNNHDNGLVAAWCSAITCI